MATIIKCKGTEKEMIKVIKVFDWKMTRFRDIFNEENPSEC